MKPGEILQFTNCRILRNHKIIVDDLWVRDGKIINPEKLFFDEKKSASRKVNCNGAIIAPGFIELQINGGFGCDFSYDVDTVCEGVSKVAKGLLSHGVTSFCPTLVTSPKEVYQKVIPKITKCPGGEHGATILGLHLEGPFINVRKKGAHQEQHIKGFDNGINTVLDMYGTLDNVRIITLAPELPGAPKVIQELCKRNITVSVGHSMGDLVDGEVAVQHGASLITHLFNAMLPFHHRDPGLVGLLTSDKIPSGKTIYFGIIADGIHTHPAALRIAHRTHPDGLVIVTDAVSALGLEEGIHHIGQMKVEIKDNCGYIAGTETLCGSITSMNRSVQIFKRATSCTTEYALEVATLHPAKVIGIEKQKGTLDYGADADLIILDDNLELISTWIAGECVYRNEDIEKSCPNDMCLKK